MNELERTKKWFETAIPEPTIDHKIVQFGCHMEEFSEMLDAIGYENTEILKFVNLESKWFKEMSWKDKQEDMINLCNKVELFDSMLDQIVTAIGVCHVMGFDIESGLREVNNSNFSKFEDGKAVFDRKGKIKKGKNYLAPNLDPVINKDLRNKNLDQELKKGLDSGVSKNSVSDILDNIKKGK